MIWPEIPYKHARVVGLGHKARQGKDTAATMLAKRYPGRVHRVAFADALYAYCRLMHGMGAKDGPLLQVVGVNFRAEDPDTWIRIAAWRIADLDADAREPFLVVIPDVRFPNELAFLRRCHGLAIKVTRVGADGCPHVDPSRPAGHVSETALDGATWDADLVNVDGAPDVLERDVHRAVARKFSGALSLSY